MFGLSIFKIGLIAMLFFVLASNVLNYVSILTTAWAEDDAMYGTIGDTKVGNIGNVSPWKECVILKLYRPKCLKDLAPIFLAIGAALNTLSLILIAVFLVVAYIWKKFSEKFALYFVIGSSITSLISLLSNSIGWFTIVQPQYQRVVINDGKNEFKGWDFGWSFWVLTGSFGASIIASVIGGAIIGYIVRKGKSKTESHTSEKKGQTNDAYYNANDQIFRL